MAGNVELVHECFPKHLLMETERMKWDRDAAEEELIYGKVLRKKSPGGVIIARAYRPRWGDTPQSSGWITYNL